MLDNKDFSNLSHEELVAKKTSFTNRKKIYLIITVALVLNTLYAIYKKDVGFFHSISILVGLFLMIDNGTKLKKVEEEIKNRKI